MADMEFQLGISLTQEYIESCSNEVEFAQKITSLVNSEGGTLWIGINAKGKIKGVYPKDELDAIPLIIANYCSSTIVFESEVKEISNKLLLVVHVKSGAKVAVLSVDGSINYYHRFLGEIHPVNKIIEKWWKFQKEQTTESPLDPKEIEMVFTCMDKTTLTQVYHLTGLSKSTVDSAISWLLYLRRIHMLKEGERVIYQHSS